MSDSVTQSTHTWHADATGSLAQTPRLGSKSIGLTLLWLAGTSLCALLPSPPCPTWEACFISFRKRHSLHGPHRIRSRNQRRILRIQSRPRPRRVQPLQSLPRPAQESQQRRRQSHQRARLWPQPRPASWSKVAWWNKQPETEFMI